eukprot:TRINITY_DN4715_c0_g1_i1.p1 TRINITY_DN4715_c0_g1~~TRINITY_DN4715_c0_g1_i1.p1  ORF type:complete len:395 (-),score=59.77 TRINITY_DN4715_c0_g1_i1:504-1688(-)
MGNSLDHFGDYAGCLTHPGNGKSGPVKDYSGGEGSSETLQLAFAYGSMQGWRDFNEDCSFALPSLGKAVRESQEVDGFWDNVAAFGVLDGHGGEQVARFCEARLPAVITTGGQPSAPSKSPRTPSSPGTVDIGKHMNDAFFTMDEMLRDSRYAEELKGLCCPSRPWKVQSPAVTGATATVCCVKDDLLICANAGDSRAVLCRGGRTVPLSYDHCPSLEKESNRIFNAGGRIHETKLRRGKSVYRINGDINVARAIGDLGYKQNDKLPVTEQLLSAEPDIITLKRSPDDEFMIIACDGIWNMMESHEVVEFVRERLDRQSCMVPMGYSTTRLTYKAILHELLENCISQDLLQTRGYGGDNVTAILVVFGADLDMAESTDEDSGSDRDSHSTHHST